MTFSYSDPSNSLSDQVRYLCGQTDSNDYVLSNEEISFELSQYSDNPKAAAISALNSIIARYSYLVNQTTGQISISYSDRIKALLILRETLQSKNYIGPKFFGTSQAQKDALSDETDFIQPKFEVGMSDRTSW